MPIFLSFFPWHLDLTPHIIFFFLGGTIIPSVHTHTCLFYLHNMVTCPYPFFSHFLCFSLKKKKKKDPLLAYTYMILCVNKCGLFNQSYHFGLYFTIFIDILAIEMTFQRQWYNSIMVIFCDGWKKDYIGMR